jgi:hypothetical protein
MYSLIFLTIFASLVQGKLLAALQGTTLAMWAEIGATVTLVRCSFADNIITGTHHNSAILSVNGVKSVPDAQLQDTICLEQCSFTRNQAWNLL